MNDMLLKLSLTQFKEELATIYPSGIKRAWYNYSTREIQIKPEKQKKNTPDLTVSQLVFTNIANDGSNTSLIYSSFPTVAFLDLYSCRREFLRLIYNPNKLHWYILENEFREKGIDFRIETKYPKDRWKTNTTKYYEMFPLAPGDYAALVFHFHESIIHHKDERRLIQRDYHR